MTFVIAAGAMALLGVLMAAAPAQCTREEQRDDPEAVAKVRKVGFMLIAAAIGASLLALKYTLT